MAKRKKQRHVLYIMGEPATGKTTVARRLTAGLPREVMKVPHVSWTHFNDDIAELGHEREAFGGTDVLSLAAQPHIIQHMEDGDLANYTFLFGEGDRLANPKFFNACLHLGYDLRVYALVPPAKVVERRRAERNALLGHGNKPHTDRWIKTRQTKVNNLIVDYSDNVTVLKCKTSDAVERITNENEVAQAMRELAAS